VTPLLREVHWLRMSQRIDYKLAVLVYRCFNGLAPSYLANDLQCVADLDARRCLRSASTSTLVVPVKFPSTVGGRAFPVAAARVWNSLPADVISLLSLSTFKRRLKTELFVRSCPYLRPRLTHCFLLFALLARPFAFVFFCFVRCPSSLDIMPP